MSKPIWKFKPKLMIALILLEMFSQDVCEVVILEVIEV